MEARILGEEDAKRYFALRVQAAGEAASVVTNELERELFVLAGSPETSMAARASQGTVTWGVYDDASLAGVLAISRRFNIQAQNHLWLWGLYVRPPHRGTPVSRLLMEAALAWCEGEPPEHRLFSAYEPTNYRARQCLHRWGFVPVPEGEVWTGPSATEPTHILVERDREPHATASRS